LQQPVLGIGLELVAAQGLELPGELGAVAALDGVLGRQHTVVRRRGGMQCRHRGCQRQGAQQPLHSI
jgi:hypothetical protein